MRPGHDASRSGSQPIPGSRGGQHVPVQQGHVPGARQGRRHVRLRRGAPATSCTRARQNIERLVGDRHYFARPARTLFNDIRRYFPMTAQARVWAVVQRYVACAEEWLDRLPQNGIDVNGQPLQCRATTRRGTACQRDAAAAQRLLPVAPAPRRDRGASTCARPSPPRRTAAWRSTRARDAPDRSVRAARRPIASARCCSGSTSAGPSPTPSSSTAAG